MAPQPRSVFTNLYSPLSLPYAPSYEPTYTRVDNGLYIVNRGLRGLTLEKAQRIQTADPSALVHAYSRSDLPLGTTLEISHWLRNVCYVLYRGEVSIARATYSTTLDQLFDVRVIHEERGKGIARALVGLILKIDGPQLISAHPSDDCPLSLEQLIKFYSSFPGYHSVPGTNKVFKLMENTMVEEADYADETAAASEFTRKPKSAMEMAVLEQNSNELKRIMAILYPMNDAEVDGLLNAQPTDILSLQNSMGMYTAAWFDLRPWGRAHRVKFAQGMASLLLKHAGQRYAVWDKIIADEAY